jgi:hypothetical protein
LTIAGATALVQSTENQSLRLGDKRRGSIQQSRALDGQVAHPALSLLVPKDALVYPL